MKQLNYVAPKMPTANIAVNKSRVKLYNKKGDLPSYYLQKGQEFQIELFNPTTETVLAKITLNGNVISQGGLILKPAQRVFLERYLDVAKKFMFDTYEVANTQESIEAIENNGDFKVEFYRESKPMNRIISNGTYRNFGVTSIHNLNTITPISNTFTTSNSAIGGSFTTTNSAIGGSFTTTNSAIGGSFTTTNSVPTSSFYNCSLNSDYYSYNNVALNMVSEPIKTKNLAKKSKSIETGRVEQGSYSDQEFKTVDKDFEFFAFHTVEAKLLPVSQKVNTSEDIKVKVYCTGCGAKLHKDHKFCGHCGTKA
jgi:hypothetical protein